MFISFEGNTKYHEKIKHLSFCISLCNNERIENNEPNSKRSGTVSYKMSNSKTKVILQFQN